MADAFRKIQDLPPLRLTVQHIAEEADEIARLADIGGGIDAAFRVSFEDGTTFERDSSTAFLANVSEEGERLQAVEVTIYGWTPSHGDGPGDIARSVSLQFRDFGSQFQVGSTDPLWGKGALDTIKHRLARYKPWYSWLLRALPGISGALVVLPIWFIVLAVAHEKKADLLAVVVIVLSVLLFVGNIWVWRRFMRQRLLANTIILRRPRERDWTWAKLILGVIAVAADIVTLSVLLLR
jgi:hypothetical protein